MQLLVFKGKPLRFLNFVLLIKPGFHLDFLCLSFARLGFFLSVLVFPAPMSVVLFLALRSFLLLFIAFRCPSLLFLAFHYS